VYSTTRGGTQRLVLGPNASSTVRSKDSTDASGLVVPPPSCMLLESKDPTVPMALKKEALEKECQRLNTQVSSTCAALTQKFMEMSGACQEVTVGTAKSAVDFTDSLLQASSFAELTCSNAANDASELMKNVQSIHRRMEQGQALLLEIKRANEQVALLEGVLGRMEQSRGIRMSPTANHR
jgi:hypothetical protein